MGKTERFENPDAAIATEEHPPELSSPLLELEVPQITSIEVLAAFWRARPRKRAHMEILLVEDNPADVRMIVDGLTEVLPEAHLNLAADGVEAMRFLRREGRHARAPRPDLVILDLRLPKKSGFDVLREIKEDPAFCNIPVVVQSSSEAQVDIELAYSLHANCYITKPAGFEEFSRTMRSLAEFWVAVVKLPSGGNSWKTN
jgi:chemotaxis family two-component system response regulator Rcp1